MVRLETSYSKRLPHGMKGVAFWSNGFKQVTNNVRPILGPQDFKGLKFRIQPSPLIERHIKNWGGKTSVIPFNDAYRNLADGSVDGQENTISNIVSKRLYQVQKYMTISNHGYLGYAVIFNKSSGIACLPMCNSCSWKHWMKQQSRQIRKQLEMRRI